MLVLSRKAQEKIRIGDNITITILRTKGKTVRVGIEAPSTVPVLRGELVFDRELAAADTPASEPQTAVVQEQPRSASPADPKTGDDWATDPQASVGYQRVPRSRVATVLPTMLGDSGPLRSMLDRRNVAQEF